jgi:hypothetical protein
MERFTVLTYNMLHGLEVSEWSVDPANRKRSRGHGSISKLDNCPWLNLT